ncbi:unnamed protein product [Caenorhabditis angaria]|uniref:Phosphate transporter n=1 Tax=Caenorhabditis angaria TaxID=860376 RepID=A0A9P1IMB0_9PELO|nr:unnamed protein product [Caenorhabditis angaria]
MILEPFTLVAIGAIIAFILAFAIGANDTANSFGTSVGSKVVTLHQAYILASIFETLGACLLGHQVTDTMRKGVIDFDSLTGVVGNSTSAVDSDASTRLIQEMMLGQIAILAGCGAWMLLATAFKLPVSTTHSIVGATIGFALVVFGTQAIVWHKIYRIFLSWVISPLSSGLTSVIIYTSLDHLVLRRKEPLHSGIRVLPVLYFICFAFNVFAIVFHGPEFLYLDKLTLAQCLMISCAVGLAVALIFAFFLAPYLKNHILSKELVEMTERRKSHHNEKNNNNNPKDLENGTSLQEKQQKTPFLSENDEDQPKIVVTRPSTDEGITSSSNSKNNNTIRPASSLASFFRSCKPEDPQASKLFSLLQVMTACFGGFAHGGNDVSNAIAPLVALVLYQSHGQNSESMPTPWWILLYGSAGMCLGLWVLGHRVIYTVGENLTKITPASGFAVEFGSAVTVLIASKFGMPISSTQCKVGSVVAVGLVQANHQVDWGVFRNISLSWIVTLPVAGLLSAGAMTLLHILSFGTGQTSQDSVLKLFF